MQNQINKQTDSWKNILVSLLISFISSLLMLRFQLAELYFEIPIIDKYLSWLSGLQDFFGPYGFIGFIGEVIFAVMFALPIMGAILIVGLPIKYVVDRVIKYRSAT